MTERAGGFYWGDEPSRIPTRETEWLVFGVIISALIITTLAVIGAVTVVRWVWEVVR